MKQKHSDAESIIIDQVVITPSILNIIFGFAIAILYTSFKLSALSFLYVGITK